MYPEVILFAIYVSYIISKYANIEVGLASGGIDIVVVVMAMYTPCNPPPPRTGQRRGGRR